MLESKTLDEIRKLDGLLKTLSMFSENSFELFPSEDNFYEMPPDHYFEIIQQVFNNPSPLKAICN
ncbi:MAG: hypothetical protein ABI855_15475 [Bacteroidota bacterium]